MRKKVSKPYKTTLFPFLSSSLSHFLPSLPVSGGPLPKSSYGIGGMLQAKSLQPCSAVAFVTF